MKKFGFIGAGKMASAIVKGMIASGKVRPEEIICACGNDDTGKILSNETGVILANSVKKVKALYEYTPLQIKQALTGNGRAVKHQVQYMTMQMLNLKKMPKLDDAADALAVALTHAQTNNRLVDASIR